MSSDIESPSQQLIHVVLCAIQALWSGAPEGVLHLQISNDNTVWTDYSGSEAEVSGPGSFLWNLSNTGFQYIRIIYTRTSGTGTLGVTFSGKGA